MHPSSQGHLVSDFQAPDRPDQVAQTDASAVPAPNLSSVMRSSPAAMLCSVLSQIASVFPPCEFMKREKGGGFTPVAR